MIFRDKFPVTLLIGFLLPLLFGCSTTGSERAQTATTKMQIVEDNIKASVEQIDATNISLQNLIMNEQSDTKAAFETYSDDVAKMVRLGEKVIKHADELSARGEDYFDEWKKQGNTYANPQIRQLSDRRRADLNAVFRNIAESSIGVKSAFIAYMSDVTQIKSFLSTDLTAKGIESITPVAQQAIRDGDSLKNAVIPVLSALGSARSEMAQGNAD